MRHHVTTDDLAASVIAVPPLARTADGDFNDAANRTIIRKLEDGGVTSIVYGGNAMAQHWPMSVYGDWLDRIVALAAKDSWILPSVGQDAGKLFDQAKILRDRAFPVALLLPMGPPITHEGMADALRLFTATSGVQVIVYIKTDGYIPPALLATLVSENVVFGVKYAVPRTVSEDDKYLNDIISAIGVERVVSGFGEPPAISHMMNQGLVGFTAGCVCISPALSNAVFQALKQRDSAKAERLIQPILPLENLRVEINEIRVLHYALAACELAQTGPILLPSSKVPSARKAEIETEARALLAAEERFKVTLGA